MAAHDGIGSITLFQAKLADANWHFVKSIALQEDLDRDKIIETVRHAWSRGNTTHSLPSWALLLQGHVGQALAARDTALTAARELNELHGLALTLHQGCVFYQLLTKTGRSRGVMCGVDCAHPGARLRSLAGYRHDIPRLVYCC